KRPDFLAVDGNRADELVLFEHRDSDKSSGASRFEVAGAHRIAVVDRLGLDVGKLSRLLGRDQPSQRGPRYGTQQEAPSLLEGRRIRRWRIMLGEKAEGLSFAEIERAKFGLAEPRRVRQYGLEDRLQVAGRARNDAQDLRCRRLLLKRLGELLFQIGIGCAKAVNVSSRHRCLRTKTGNAFSVFRPLASQDHLVGIVTCLSILTQPRMRSRLFTLDHVVGAIRGTGRYGISRGIACIGLMLAATITLPHFLVSSEMSLPKSAGEPASTVPLRLASRALNFGSAMLILTSLFSLSMSSTGVLFGAPIPYHPLAS